MSGTFPANPPDYVPDGSPSVQLMLDGRPRDLGGFTVRRVLPAIGRRMVGPFVFFDHIGPAQLPLGTGLDVRPHPHIALATVTYLYDGEIIHRDSLGSLQAIRPGDINWMVAGRGIAHSERSSPEERRAGVRLHGIQSWVALLLEHEETQPLFEHHPATTIPTVRFDGGLVDVLAGTGFGQRSPVGVLSPTLYAHALLEAEARLPVDDEHPERAVYIAEGAIGIDGRTFETGTMVVLRPGTTVEIQALQPARLMLVGGAPVGERHVWWNFVASTHERIERAKDDWKNGRFPRIPGDDVEFIPLPDQ